MGGPCLMIKHGPPIEIKHESPVGDKTRFSLKKLAPSSGLTNDLSDMLSYKLLIPSSIPFQRAMTHLNRNKFKTENV